MGAIKQYICLHDHNLDEVVEEVRVPQFGEACSKGNAKTVCNCAARAFFASFCFFVTRPRAELEEISQSTAHAQHKPTSHHRAIAESKSRGDDQNYSPLKK